MIFAIGLINKRAKQGLDFLTESKMIRLYINSNNDRKNFHNN
ncbi:MAG: hypothetical protein PG981_000809 [Wolbachia endosymbiont of Ctenocephalides orientis wCori]|nr:MAG: hypothetical protein PG981_000809 [Wolbachia endosymbiont of Ctenocephalides orientis wCori]